MDEYQFIVFLIIEFISLSDSHLLGAKQSYTLKTKSMNYYESSGLFLSYYLLPFSTSIFICKHIFLIKCEKKKISIENSFQFDVNFEMILKNILTTFTKLNCHVHLHSSDIIRNRLNVIWTLAGVCMHLCLFNLKIDCNEMVCDCFRRESSFDDT